MKMKIHEQITFLRKQKGLTQEELAKALGVSNQAVSKWESAQCCPDIQLLPEIAEFFSVSIDELFGFTPVSTAENIVLDIRKRIDSLSEGEDFQFVLHIAAALHTIILSKEMTAKWNQNPGWDTDDAIEHAGNGEWGYSCYDLPGFTTVMRRGSIFFSNNRDINLMNAEMRRIVSIIKPFANTENLRAATALYQLTAHAEDAYADITEVSEKAGMPEEKVMDCLTGELAMFLVEKEDAQGQFRFEGMYGNLIPMLSLFDCR